MYNVEIRRRTQNTNGNENDDLDVIFQSNSDDQKKKTWSSSRLFRVTTKLSSLLRRRLIPVVISSLIIIILVFVVTPKLRSIKMKSTFMKSTKININEPITHSELLEARRLQREAKAKARDLTKLRPVDREYYTVRINTWKRNDSLLTCVKHYLTCRGVKQIQVVWCDKENSPPPELIELAPKVIIEYHDLNSLNERFRIIETTSDNSNITTPTLGILSVDDDIIRPCEALDDGFFRWTDNPDRIVGFDTRGHILTPVESLNSSQLLINGITHPELSFNEAQELYSQSLQKDQTHQWSYKKLSGVKRDNLFSITLTRYCFLHADYLKLYMEYLPPRILTMIEETLNCEDIAMSFFVSSLTEKQRPLLADKWAMDAFGKMESNNSISGQNVHFDLRNNCVDTIAFLLGLKDSEEGKPSFELKKVFYNYPRDQTHRSFLGLADSKHDYLYEDRSGFGERRLEFTKLFRDQVFLGKIHEWARGLRIEMRNKVNS